MKRCPASTTGRRRPRLVRQGSLFLRGPRRGLSMPLCAYQTRCGVPRFRKFGIFVKFMKSGQSNSALTGARRGMFSVIDDELATRKTVQKEFPVALGAHARVENNDLAC